MTWWLWLLLVLVALAVFAVLGVRLWHKGKALFREMQALSEVGERLAAITGDEPPAPVVLPGFLAGPAELAEARLARAQNLAARRARRHDRAQTAITRWRRLGLR
ncbi:hypothetical protein FHE66_04270 [Georgenia sp. 311]|uniref:Uncharacterized protein n=1 Tax=Georgenia wutianyii TaxID=2585135 RepID=A0ABX5VNE4_9MICO|nr:MULTISPECIES: hypothetical protein [Georgenia]QDB79196.1 hypothetical protein FE251_07290 [Georgenia wutianyii]TNC19136.1 hypothetical protein FHE66_04270 [Georgenia sp. 311]